MDTDWISGHTFIWFVFRSITVIAGVLITYMGYRLLCLGIMQPAEGTDVEAIWGDRKLLLKRATPGVIFAFVGVAVIIGALLTAPQGTFSRTRREQAALPSAVTPPSGDPATAPEFDEDAVVETTTTYEEEEWDADESPAE